jgi:hypothetical protein
MVVLPNEAELLEKRLMELCAQMDNLDLAQGEMSLPERVTLRVELCREYTALLDQVRALKAGRPETLHKSKTPSSSQAEVSIRGRARLRLIEAVERALEQCDRPLRADEIAHFISENTWIRQPSRGGYVESVRGAIKRHRDKLGIVCVGDGGPPRRYWLSRRGPPPDHA